MNLTLILLEPSAWVFSWQTIFTFDAKGANPVPLSITPPFSKFWTNSLRIFSFSGDNLRYLSTACALVSINSIVSGGTLAVVKSVQFPVQNVVLYLKNISCNFCVKSSAFVNPTYSVNSDVISRHLNFPINSDLSCHILLSLLNVISLLWSIYSSFKIIPESFKDNVLGSTRTPFLKKVSNSGAEIRVFLGKLIGLPNFPSICPSICPSLASKVFSSNNSLVTSSFTSSCMISL